MPELIAIKPAPGFKPAVGDKPAEGPTFVLVRGTPGTVRRVLERPTVVEKTAEVLRALRRGDIMQSTAAEVAEASAVAAKAGEAANKRAKKASDDALKANEKARADAEAAATSAAAEQQALAALAASDATEAAEAPSADSKGTGDSR